MVLPTEVVLTTKALVLALAKPTSLQVTHLVSAVAVILGQALALDTASTAPVGEALRGDDGRALNVAESLSSVSLLFRALVVE